MEKSKGVDTPGVKERQIEKGDDEKLSKADATSYRGITMRANYYCQNRLEAKFAVKECAREMKDPTVGSKKALKRMARYFQKHKRVVQKIRYQGAANDESEVTTVKGEGDTNHADCKKTRKSTSGGVGFHGKNALTHWSATQAEPALSSGESEYKGALKTAAEMMFIRTMINKDFANDKITETIVGIDSSAAKAIAGRIGLGKLKHLDTRYLWLQAMV